MRCNIIGQSLPAKHFKMKRISIHRLYKERNNIPAEKVFFIYDESLKPVEVALSIKINDKFYNSEWFPENVKNWKRALSRAMTQIAIIQKTGWAKVEDTTDQWGYPTTLFRCAYCNTHDFDPHTECACRDPLAKFSLSPETALFPNMTKGNIILP